METVFLPEGAGREEGTVELRRVASAADVVELLGGAA
jgi:hypothetical protein